MPVHVPMRQSAPPLSRREFVVASLAGSLAATFDLQALAASARCSFKGRIVAEWLSDGRTMQLTEPFAYIGPDGRSWRVPKGAEVDGASIPILFWSIIGGPFVGLYRAPSVVHDFYCNVRTRKYQDVHQAFHDAMLCAGVGPKRAWLMHQAVVRFGPSWPDPKIDPRCETVDANYELTRCARNTAPPQIKWPDGGKHELQRFADESAGKAAPEDVAKLRDAIAKMLEASLNEMRENFEAGRCVKIAPGEYECPTIDLRR